MHRHLNFLKSEKDKIVLGAIKTAFHFSKYQLDVISLLKMKFAFLFLIESVVKKGP